MEANEIQAHYANALARLPGSVVAPFILVIDGSGSMNCHRSSVLEMIQTLVGEAQRMPGAENGILCILAFADKAYVLLPPTPLSDVDPNVDYAPKGSTALYAANDDALGLVLALHASAQARPTPPTFRATIVVLSDGEDNRSPDRKIPGQDKAAQARQLGFTLRAIGVGIDHVTLSRDLGFDPGLGVTVAATAAGMHHASVIISQSMTGTITGVVVDPNASIPPSGPVSGG